MEDDEEDDDYGYRQNMSSSSQHHVIEGEGNKGKQSVDVNDAETSKERISFRILDKFQQRDSDSIIRDE
jgi:hypothetical protein